VKIVRKRLADGSEAAYYYHRATGRPIKAAPGSREWPFAYLAAGQPKPQPKAAPMDLEWLISRYQASPDWTMLAKATKETRRSYFKRIIARFQGAELSWFDSEETVSVLYEWRDEMAAQPMTADKSFDALRVLLSWAKSRRLIKLNWAKEIERLTPATHNRAELTWAPELWETILAAARQDERDLLEFAMYSAARESDIAAMKWAQFDGEWLVYKPQKTARRTGVVVSLPVHALPPFAALMGKLSRGTEYVLTTDTGAPWSASNIKLRMRSLKARAFPAGDPGRTFHDIRGTAISRLYDAGCTDAEVASVDGHQIGRGTMLGRYAMGNYGKLTLQPRTKPPLLLFGI
jgi:integrase